MVTVETLRGTTLIVARFRVLRQLLCLGADRGPPSAPAPSQANSPSAGVSPAADTDVRPTR